MRHHAIMVLGLVLALAPATAAQDVIWRAGTAKPGLVTLGRPSPLQPPAPPDASANAAVTLARPRPVFRGQSPDPFPPPPPPAPPPSSFPAPGPAGVGVGIGPEEAYNCGVVNDSAAAGSVWQRVGNRCRQCYEDVFSSVKGMCQPGLGRQMFQSDHAFDVFISPVTQPFTFEDPRALTEVRPIFIWQQTPSGNSVFAGGDNFFAGLQARVAFTERISLVVNEVGWIWMDPDGTPTPGFTDSSGFAQVRVGPKFTIVRNDVSNTLAAVGLTFEIPAGSESVLQDTGNLALTPYFSFGQNFGKTKYGSFNFLSTAGYSLGMDSDRSDFLFTNFHLDFDVLDLKKFYPLVEVNWVHYTANGGTNPALDFDGWDLFNFGSGAVSGRNELTVALGGRYLVSQNLQFGVAAELGVLGGVRSLNNFRLTADMIIRY